MRTQWRSAYIVIQTHITSRITPPPPPQSVTGRISYWDRLEVCRGAASVCHCDGERGRRGGQRSGLASQAMWPGSVELDVVVVGAIDVAVVEPVDGDVAAGSPRRSVVGTSGRYGRRVAPVPPQKASAGELDQVRPEAADGDDDAGPVPESCLVILDGDVRADLQGRQWPGCCIISFPCSLTPCMSAFITLISSFSPSTWECGVVHRHHCSQGVAK